MIHILELPNEILHHIGDYMNDASRRAAALTCHTFRDIFSYLHPSRILPQGRILLGKQVRFLDKVRRYLESPVSINTAPPTFGFKHALICDIHVSLEPYLMMALIFEMLLGVLVVGKKTKRVYLEETYIRYLGKYAPYQDITDEEKEIRAESLIELHNSKRVISSSRRRLRNSHKFWGLGVYNVCIIGKGKWKAKKIMRKLQDTCHGLLPCTQGDNTGILLIFRIHKDDRDIVNDENAHIILGGVTIPVIQSGDIIASPRTHVINHGSVQNIRKRCKEELTEQLERCNGDASRKIRLFQNPKLNGLKWRIASCVIKDTILRLFSKHGSCPILIRGEWFLLEDEFDYFMSWCVVNFSDILKTEGYLVSPLIDENEYILKERSLNEESRSQDKTGCALIILEEPLCPIKVSYKTRHIITICKMDGCAKWGEWFTEGATFENEKGQRIISSPINVHFISIKSLIAEVEKDLEARIDRI